MGIVDIIVFFAFIACVMFVSLWKSGGEAGKSADDYFLAGRGLSWWLIGFSLIAANISAEQFVGMSGQGCCKTLQNAENSPHYKESSNPKW